MEMMKDKLNNWKLIHKGMNPDAEAYLIWHRFGRVCLITLILFPYKYVCFGLF
jgi:hypothetical protein